jgi:Zn-dependent membrane protease YugP
MEFISYPYSLFGVVTLVFLGLIVHSFAFQAFRKFSMKFPEIRLSGNEFAKRFLKFTNRTEIEIITPRQERKRLAFNRYYMFDNNIYLQREVYQNKDFTSIAYVSQELGHALTANSNLRKLMYVRCFLIVFIMMVNKYFSLLVIGLFLSLLLSFPITFFQVLNIILFIQIVVALSGILFLPLEFVSNRAFLREFDKMNLYENENDKRMLRKVLSLVKYKYLIISFSTLSGLANLLGRFFGLGRLR